MKVTDKLASIIKDAVVGWTLPANFVYSFDNPTPVEPIRFLSALSMCESSGGIHRVPRFEPGYGPSGKYYNRDLYAKWGAWACCSYSSFQILFTTATELGYTGNPVELHLKDEVTIVGVLLVALLLLNIYQICTCSIQSYNYENLYCVWTRKRYR